MTYTVPQVVVFQEFQAAAESALVVRLPACIIGPQYTPFRYSEADEKQLVSIGEYAYIAGNTAIWPNKPAGSVVDQDWTSLYFDDAWHEYFRDINGSAYATIGYTDASDNAYANRIRSDTLIFASYSTWARSSVFNARDVKVGDGVIIKATVGSDEYEIETRVNALVHDAVAASVDTATEDTANVADTVAAASITLTAGTAGVVSVAADGALYDGAATGDISEVYTLAVVQAGAFGAATLSVSSASGNDTPTSYIVPTDGVAVAIGANGLKATFSSVGSDTPFVAGQTWRVDVAQLWTAATITAAGTYVGTSDGTYVIDVTTGGDWADSPQVFISSTGTLESSGPFVVSDDTYVVTPNGMQFKFANSATGLAQGDKYYVEVTAAGLGPVHSLDLLNSLPAALFASGSEAAAVLDISLSIVKDIEVAEIRSGTLTNWTTSATQIAVTAGISGTDSTWYNAAGTLLSLPVIKADMFVEYRALIRTYISSVNSVTTVAEAIAALGSNTPDNPLCYAVTKAVANSGGLAVYYIATDGDETDVDAFSSALGLIYDNQNTYGIVPLTHTRAVQDIVVAHVNAASGNAGEQCRWRVCWFGAEVSEKTVVVDKNGDGDMLMATVADDPTTTGTQYSLLTCDDAEFVTDGALAGQTVRINYSTSPTTGLTTYTEALIDEVISEEQLRLVTGLTSAITVATRMEVWKTNTLTELATQVATFAGSFANKRVRIVWPDVITDGTGAVDNMFLCAALAGLRGGSYPHQGLTNVEVSGFVSAPRTSELFGGVQLDLMATSGVWIVTQDAAGSIYTRHQLTTDMSAVEYREDSYVANVDSTSYYYLNFFNESNYIGQRNITPGLMSQLEADFDGASNALIQATKDTTIGEQILKASLTTLQRHATLRDRIQATVSVDFPEPLNNLDITLLSLAQ